MGNRCQGNGIRAMIRVVAVCCAQVVVCSMDNRNTGRNSLWSNGSGSRVHIRWIPTTCKPTKSLRLVCQKFRDCAKAILPAEQCISWTWNVQVCNGQCELIVDKRITLLTRTKDADNLYCNGDSSVQGSDGNNHIMKSESGVPGYCSTSDINMVTCWWAEGIRVIEVHKPSSDTW